MKLITRHCCLQICQVLRRISCEGVHRERFEGLMGLGPGCQNGPKSKPCRGGWGSWHMARHPFQFPPARRTVDELIWFNSTSAFTWQSYGLVISMGKILCHLQCQKVYLCLFLCSLIDCQWLSDNYCKSATVQSFIQMAGCMLLQCLILYIKL